jgi:hypothetical protein
MDQQKRTGSSGGKAREEAGDDALAIRVRMSTSSRCSSASVSSIEGIACMNAGITTPLISCCKSIGSPDQRADPTWPGGWRTRRRQWQRSSLAAHDPSSVSAASAAAVNISGFRCCSKYKVFRRGSNGCGQRFSSRALRGSENRRHRRRVPHPSRNPDRISIYTMHRDPRWCVPRCRQL